MKKNKSLSLFLALIIFTFVLSINSNAVDPPTRDDGSLPKLYQTMRYCGGTLTYACTSKALTESCRRYKCITSY